MGDFTLPLRAALITAFSADAALILLIGNPPGSPVRIHDGVPPEQVFPYIRLGDDSIGDYGDKSEPGQEFFSNFHIFDRNTPSTKGGYRGQKVVNQIQARLYAILHEKQLTIDGGQAYLVRFSSQRAMSDDGLMWHGISRYRFLLS